MKTRFFQKITMLVALLLAAAASLPSRAQTVANPSFTLSTYYVHDFGAHGEFLGPPGGMAIDTATRTLYVGNSDGLLKRIAPDGTYTNLGNFVASGFYPYLSADIQFLNGSIYMANSAGLNRFNISSGVSTIAAPFESDYNAGLAAIGTTLYNAFIFSNGVLNVFDTSTSTMTSLPIAGMPDYPSSMEYDPVSHLLYFADNNNVSGQASDIRFFSINLETATVAPLAGTLPANVYNAYGNFAVDPNGQFLYTRNGTEVDQVNVSTGAVTAFITGLQNDGTNDLVFGPSSAGPGSSLYVEDAEVIYEVQGFTAMIPEPSTTTLLGFLGLGALAQRRRRAR